VVTTADLVKAKNIEKTLVLVMTSRLVNNKKFLDALDDRLAPPLSKAGEDAALRRFRSQFDFVTVTPGLRVSFTVKGSKLVTKANGREIGTIDSQVLSETLLDSYLGADPVSKPAKESFGKGLARMVLS
jgi:hypothetical protein